MGTAIKHPTAGIPTQMPSGFCTGMVSAGMVTQGQVSGHQSIMTSSTTNLHKGQEPRVMVTVQQPVHGRTRSDANHMHGNYAIS